MSEENIQRIHDLHAWYQRNVLPMRLTPEVERLWWDWLNAGYNGYDLRDVIRYIRRQISLGKRNEGALKLSNLLARTESGFMKFDEDLALSRARQNLNVDRKLEPVPDAARPAPAIAPAARNHDAPKLTDEQRARGAEALKQFRKGGQA